MSNETYRAESDHASYESVDRQAVEEWAWNEAKRRRNVDIFVRPSACHEPTRMHYWPAEDFHTGEFFG